MSHKHFLFSEEGKIYLLSAYVTERKSTGEIAKEKNTYPNMVNRALKFHGIEIRTRSDAQKIALERGVKPHPTKGKEMTQEIKNRIAASVQKKWENMTDEERERRGEQTSEQWKNRTDSEIESIRKKANTKIRESAKHGSKLERYVSIGLQAAGYTVNFHTEMVLENEKMQIDLTLDKNGTKIAIEIDGPTHFYPIFGQEQLDRNIRADAEKNGLLLSAGYKVIRIKNLKKNLSDKNMRDLLAKLLTLLNGELKDFQEISVES